jgi:hypothetical protein
MRNVGSALLALAAATTACSPLSAVEDPVVIDASQGRDHWRTNQGPIVVRSSERLAGRYLVLQLIVDESGRVVAVKPSRGKLNEDVEAAVRRWRFRPFIVAGRAQSVTFPATVPVYPPELPPRRHVVFPSGDLSSVIVRLERTACYGRCPAYSVEIRGDGSVTYRGTSSVAVVGQRNANISPEVVSRLVEQFRAANFFALEDRYESQITDNPTKVLTLEIGGQKKSVTDYVGLSVGMPSAVAVLENAVDDAAGTRRWIDRTPSAESH